MGCKTRLFCTFGSYCWAERAFFNVWWNFLDYLSHVQALFLANGLWGLKEKCVGCSSSWNGNYRALLVSISCQPVTLFFSFGCPLPYTGCSRTAMEVIKLSKRAGGIFTLLFLILSHHTQLFSANALWSLGSVFNVRDLLSENQCCYFIVLFGVYTVAVSVVACSWVWGHCPGHAVAGLQDAGKGDFYQRAKKTRRNY